MTLTLDLDAAAFVGAEGAAVGAANSGFPDVSGWGREFRQATAGSRPTYSSTVMNGLPGIVFGGSHWLDGQGSLSQYYGASGFAMLVAFRARALAAAGAHDYDDAAVWTDAGGYTGLSVNSTPVVTGFVYDPSDKPRTRTIALNQVVVAAFYLSGGQLYLGVNGGSYTNTASGVPSTMTGLPKLGKSLSGVYFNGAIGRVRCWDSLPSDFATQYSELLTRYGLQRFAGLEDARDVGSRIVRRDRRPSAMVPVRVRWSVGLSLEPGDLVWLSHPELPHPQGSGAGVKKWERWPGIIFDRQANPDKTMDLQVEKLLPFSLWWVPHTPSSGLIQQQGVCRILSGQSWTYTRASTAYVEDPGDGTVIEAPIDVEAIGSSGFLAESARTHSLLNSVFAEGTTTPSSWTGLVQATLDSTVTFFQPGISPNSCKMAFSGGTAAEATQTISSGGAQYWYLSVRHLEEVGAALDWRLQRSSDSKYYDASDQTWKASSSTVNFFATRTTKTRDYSGLIDAGAAPGNLTLRLRNAVANNLWVGSVQLEPGRWPTSDMPTRTVAFSRSAGQLLVSNNSAARAWNAARGTARIELMPWWTSSEIGSSAMTLIWLSYDANNSVRLWYDGSAAAWKFTRKAAGVSTTASVTASVTRGTAVEIVVRWAGSDLELGLAAYTGSVFAAGAKGTDDTSAAGAPTEVATCNVELGSGSSAYAEGFIRRVLLTPVVLSDSEIARAD